MTMNHRVSPVDGPRSPDAPRGIGGPFAGGMRAPRRPYAPPRIESGEAFERVQLASDCNNVLPGECDPVC